MSNIFTSRSYLMVVGLLLLLVGRTMAATEVNLIEASPGFEADASVNPKRPPTGWIWQERSGPAVSQQVSVAEGYESKTGLRLKKIDTKSASCYRICHPLRHVTLEAGATYRFEFAYRNAETLTGDTVVSVGISSTGGSGSSWDGTDDFLSDAVVSFKKGKIFSDNQWHVETVEFVPSRRTAAPFVLISQSYWANYTYDITLDNFRLVKVADAPKSLSEAKVTEILLPQGDEGKWAMTEISNPSWEVGVDSQKTETTITCQKDFGLGYLDLKTTFPAATDWSKMLELSGQFTAQWEGGDAGVKKASPKMQLWGAWLQDAAGKKVLHIPWAGGRLKNGGNHFTALLNYPFPLWNEKPQMDQLAAVTLRFNLPQLAGKFLIRLAPVHVRSATSDLGDGILQADFMDRRKEWFASHPANCGDFFVGAGSVHTKYGPSYLPETAEPTPGGTVQFSTAGNGHAMAQLVALPSPTAKANDLTWSLGELTHEKTKKSLALPWSMARVTHTPILPLEFETVLAGRHPDPFCHAATIHLNPKMSHSLWLKGKVPAGTPAGIYRGQLKMKAASAEKPLVIPVELEVWGFDLPAENKIKTSIWIDRAPLKRWEQKWKIPMAEYSPYLDMVLDHRLSPIDVDPEYFVWREKDGRYTFELAEWQEYIEHCTKVNPGAFNTLNLGPNHYFGSNLKGGFEVRDRETKQLVEYDRAPFSEKNQELMGAYLKTAQDWLRQKGWLKKAYVQPTDEPTGETDSHEIQRTIEAFKKLKCEAPLLLTLPDQGFHDRFYEMLKAAEIWVPILQNVRQKDIREQRKLGHEVWGYVCMGGAPLIGGDNLNGSRAYWLELWKRKLDGFLFWGVNCWYEEKDLAWEKEGVWNGYRKGTNGPESVGDGVLLYPGPSSSLRLEALLQGVEDYHYLWMLREACERRKKLANPPTDLVQAAEDLLAVEDIQKKIERETQAWDRFRSQTAELIVKLQVAP